ncbi:unnamed protein product [Urochloa humidicola]
MIMATDNSGELQLPSNMAGDAGDLQLLPTKTHEEEPELQQLPSYYTADDDEEELQLPPYAADNDEEFQTPPLYTEEEMKLQLPQADHDEEFQTPPFTDDDDEDIHLSPSPPRIPRFGDWDEDDAGYSHSDATTEVMRVIDVLEESNRMIHRYPPNLRPIGTEKDYIFPRTVSIGPYYHNLPELQAMEKVKHKAVNYFFDKSDQPNGAIYGQMNPVALKARDYYSDTNTVEAINDTEFTKIMLFDGCFLLLFICIWSRKNREWVHPRLRDIIQRNAAGIKRDMMLLENQIPWEVLEFLMPIMKLTLKDIVSFLVASCVGPILSKQLSGGVDIKRYYKPSQLLDLLSHCVFRNKRDAEALSVGNTRTTNASELTEIGIKLKATDITQFSDMTIVKGLFSATFSLRPLDLSNASACLLTNMAALEMCAGDSFQVGEYPLSSYLCVLGLLMNQENDVRELRARRVVRGLFGDQQTLEFFKDLCPNLVAGRAYWRLFHDIEEYRQKRWLWVTIYRFVYNNAKTIVTVLSVIGVLVGIFKALLSLKQNHQ